MNNDSNKPAVPAPVNAGKPPVQLVPSLATTPIDPLAISPEAARKLAPGEIIVTPLAPPADKPAPVLKSVS